MIGAAEGAEEVVAGKLGMESKMNLGTTASRAPHISPAFKGPFFLLN